MPPVLWQYLLITLRIASSDNRGHLRVYQSCDRSCSFWFAPSSVRWKRTLNLTFNTNLASGYGSARQYDLALYQYKKTIEIDPNYASAHNNLADTYRDMGKYDLWLEEWKRGATLADDRERLAIAEETARAYAKGGLRAAVSRMIELRKQLARRRYVDPASIAYDYATLGDKDQAFFWLEKAYSEKAESLQFLKVVKEMDPFRSDPRYIDLLTRMGLPQ
jgi:tetratricopeptide (TPR) repeat protein